MATINMHRAKDGSVSYRVRVRRKGQPIQTASFTSIKDAKRYAAMIEGQIIAGRHFPDTTTRKHTLAEVIARYNDEVMPLKSPTTQDSQKYPLIYWNKRLGYMVLEDIQPQHIIAARNDLAKKDDAATVIKYLSVLSHLFTTAMKEFQWMTSNPCRLVSKPKQPQGRLRYLSDEERQRVLSECQKSQNAYLYPLIVVSLSTACRQRELLERTWQDADVDRGLLYLERTKNGSRRVVPLVGLALDLLRQMRTEADPKSRIFPSANSANPWRSYRKAWELVLKRCQIRNYHWHDNRHSAASYLVQCGNLLYTIGAILGHTSPVMTARYAHLQTDNLREALEVMTNRIF
jgi:integrase